MILLKQSMTYSIKFLIILFFLNASLAFGKGINLIRDAEIENFLAEIAAPIIEEANLKNSKITFYLDKQNYINALVTKGPTIFITSELLIKTKTIDEIAGVIGHEIGHITGGHLSKRMNAGKDSLATSIISSILAAGAFISGAPEAGSAILLGGQQIGTQQMLQFSRNQESFADQAAIKFLKPTGYSIKGIYDLFRLLEQKERLAKFNPYSLTHPLSSERKKIILYHLENNKEINNKKKKELRELEKKFALVQAKLIGFISTSETSQTYYPVEKNTVESWYANSIQFFKAGKINMALKFISKCIEYDPLNPYFHELKAQIYYENGQSELSIKSIERALSINKNEKHFFLALAKALYLSNKKENYSRSIALLRKFIKLEDFPVEAYHFLGLSYGKLEEYSLSSIALAEKFLLLNDIKNAKLQLKKAKRFNKKDKAISSKINDLKFILEQKEKK